MPRVLHHRAPLSTLLFLSQQAEETQAAADASNVAYGGVVYIRTLYEDATVSVGLVHAKTMVAPLSPAGTTPRLELCGAQVLCKLLVTAMTALDIPLQDVFARSDSTIILCWLHMPPDQLNTYVSNRVGDILTRVPAQHWRTLLI